MLEGRRIFVRIPQLLAEIDAEITALIRNGKPRLRKDDSNNRHKLHLVPLVMAAARLPYPAREDRLGTVQWPLEHRSFIVSEMEFELVSSDRQRAVLVPLTAHILHSDRTIDLQARFNSIATDAGELPKIQATDAILGEAITRHVAAVKTQKNSDAIRNAAESAITRQTSVYGSSNAAAISTIENLPPTTLEDDIKGREGRVLTRLHSYKERDRDLVKKAKEAFLAKHGALRCECCGIDLGEFYGKRGEGRIVAHHKTPVEELLPDTITTVADLAMVCPNCHDIIHAKRPWLSVAEIRELLSDLGPGS
jgi:5-methylcytosine-specific restriction protein A